MIASLIKQLKKLYKKLLALIDDIKEKFTGPEELPDDEEDLEEQE